MRLRLLTACTGLLFLVLSTPSSFAVDSDGWYGPNDLKSSADVTVYRENDRGVASHVEGRLMDKIARGAEISSVISFFEQHKATFRMTNPAEELQPLRVDVDRLGNRHVRLSQRYHNLPVIGKQLIAHINEQGTLYAVNGSFEANFAVDISPRLTEAEAVAIAEKDLLSFFGPATPGKVELVIFPWEGDHYLSHRLFLISSTPMGRWEYFVDAHTGEIIYRANRIMNAEAIGTGQGTMGGARNHIDTWFTGSTYEMNDYTRRANNDIHGHGGQMPSGNYIRTYLATSSLPGTLATDADNIWGIGNANQAAAVDGQVYSGLVYDYLLGHLGRNGYDDAGATMWTSVNYSAEGDNNAYWNGQQIVIWSWSSGWRSLAGSPDVIAHEWGHAVTETTSGLIYQKESGALNESFSDMIGAAFEFAHDTLDTPDWQMGENGRTSGVGFRDMANPHAFGDPDTYGPSDPYWVDVISCTPSWTNDYCGVHTNSGVGNKWFSLLSDGGVHNSITVNGIGVQNAMLVVYQANAFYWTSNSDYLSAATATLTAADDLDSTGVWALETSRAWNAVNVSTPFAQVSFSYPSGVPTIVAPVTPTGFQVDVAGSVGGTPVAGSGMLHYSIDGSPTTSVAMTDLGGDSYTATLPAIACGSSISFYVSAEEQTNGLFYDPDTSNPNIAIATTGTEFLFVDSFQSDLGWTVSGSVTDGPWGRGIPIGGGTRGDPPTDYDGNGWCYLTDNVSGNSDVDGGTTILTSPSFDLSGGDAEIKYARWYSNNFGNDPFNDIMEVYISNDNGGSWTLAETVGPVQDASGGWVEHSFQVSDFVTPATQMKLRFEASDLGAGSVVEAAVDMVTVTRYLCGPTNLLILTDSLSQWTAGLAYSKQLQAGGGTPPYAWTDKFGDLTGSGLSLTSGGLLSGTPTAGTINFTAEVSDAASGTDSKPFGFVVNAAPAISTTTLPDWTEGVAYSQTLTSSGGTGTLMWSDAGSDLSGTGLTLSSTLGEVWGTPTGAGSINLTARVTDDLGATADQLLPFVINPALVVTTTSLPDWTEGQVYTQQLVATGGTGNRAWVDLNNDLSGTGLSLSATGQISGTPSAAGTIAFTARVSDDVGAVNNAPLSIVVNGNPQITSFLLPDGNVGQAYSYQLTVSGGTGVMTWTDVNNDLAGTGLSVTTSGQITGTPATAGTISFTARVTDEASAFDDQVLGFTVNSDLAVTTLTLPDWTAGYPYSQQLTSTGGLGVLTWSDLVGNLAGTGLSLSADGLLTGSPTSAGTINFTARVSDEAGAFDDQALSILVNAALAITTSSLPEWTEGQAYPAQQLAASGGTGAQSWVDLNADLAGTGLSLSPSGQLSGTPAASGGIAFTARVSDDVGASSDQPLTVTINAVVSIVTDTLPWGIAGDPYSYQIQYSGGTGAITFSDKFNDLSGTGISLMADGTVSGTYPDHNVVLTFTAVAVDPTGSSDERPFALSFNPAYVCGDVDGDGSNPDVVDLTYLVDFLFASGPLPPVIEASDVDASGGNPDIVDLTLLVDFMFGEGAVLVCP
ncbi:MAG: M4 family metallopeptidase [Candidatus Zixiibacteriota bacterium]